MPYDSPTHHNVLYLSHGGGPMPLLGDAGHRDMVDTLKRIIEEMLKKPAAVIVVSAHWETDVASVTHSPSPPLIYDYYGFLEAAYRIAYPAPGAPALAEEICRRVNEAGYDCVTDDRRGFDHGMFVPLKIMYPDADIPCVQLSLVRGLDPEKHIRIGEALRGLGYDNLLVIGSGFSFHNMEAFFSPSPERTEKNDAFRSWLIRTCSDAALPETERRRRLVHWEEAPFARYCHPRAEHLLPLHVCYGMAGRACRDVFTPVIFGVAAATFLW